MITTTFSSSPHFSKARRTSSSVVLGRIPNTPNTRFGSAFGSCEKSLRLRGGERYLRGEWLLLGERLRRGVRLRRGERLRRLGDLLRLGVRLRLGEIGRAHV